MAENKFENSGNFQGATLVQGSTLNNAILIAGGLAKGDDASRNELQSLIRQLGEALKTLPPQKKDDVEAVAASADDLMQEAAKETPNKSRLRLFGDSLITVAKTVSAAAPPRSRSPEASWNSSRRSMDSDRSKALSR